MLQSYNISDRAQSIVSSYFRPAKNDSIYLERSKVFIVSLYATMPQAKTEKGELVMSKLRTYETDLLDYMTTEDLRILQMEYSAVIQYCYEIIDKTGLVFLSLSGYLGRIPKEIIDLCLSISEPSDGSSVYLPFAGESQFGFYLPNCLIEGFESNKEEWAFSQILLDSKRINSHIENREPDTAVYSGERQYDYIFTAPPFVTGNNLRPIVNELYHLATKALKPNGEMYCILPMSFCSTSSGFFALRKVLLDYHGLFSAAVISLPEGVLRPRSNVNICLFALFKDYKNRVMLVDATSSEFLAMRDATGLKRFELKVKAILETIEKQDSKHMWVGYPTELTDFLNLTPSRYLIEQTLPKPKIGERLVALSDIIEIVSTERFEAPVEGYKFIDMKLLSSNYLNCTIDNNIGLSKMTRIRMSTRLSRRLSDNQSLLFAYQAGKVYVGKLSGFDDNTVVAIPNNILPFKLKRSIVTEDFILRSLLSSAVIQQIEMLNGSSHDHTRAKDFLRIKIIVPAIDEQNRLCREDTRISLTEADKKLIESNEDYRRDMHIKKHAVGQTISNLNNWWNILLEARAAGNGILRDDDVIGASRQLRVAKIFDNIQHIISQLQTQIYKFDRGNGLIATEIVLLDFLDHYIATHESPSFMYIPAYRLSVIKEEEGDELENSPDTKIQVNKRVPSEKVVFPLEALTIILDNIISNACEHGFKDKHASECRIMFKIVNEGTDHVIEVSNNGTPISEGITDDDIFRYGRTTMQGQNHFGIGGYEIKQLMREFDGDVEIISSPSEAFSVTYRLIFHNTIL